MSALKNNTLYALFEYIRPFLHYSISTEKKLPEGKVLLISPNQYDWAIGCSGVLLKHVQNGGILEIVHCTNEGSERMKESEKAAAFLNIKKKHFFQFPLNGLKADKNFCESLVKLFSKVNPEIVFLPFWFDNCPDHIALSNAFMEIKKDIDLHFTVYAYGVWTPIIPNCIFDISAQWKTKEEIIQCYGKTKKDFVKMAQGINQYWGAVSDSNIEYAEAFFTSAASKYISLGKKILK